MLARTSHKARVNAREPSFRRLVGRAAREYPGGAAKDVGESGAGERVNPARGPPSFRLPRRLSELARPD